MEGPSWPKKERFLCGSVQSLLEYGVASRIHLLSILDKVAVLDHRPGRTSLLALGNCFRFRRAWMSPGREFQSRLQCSFFSHGYPVRWVGLTGSHWPKLSSRLTCQSGGIGMWVSQIIYNQYSMLAPGISYWFSSASKDRGSKEQLIIARGVTDSEELFYCHSVVYHK